MTFVGESYESIRKETWDYVRVSSSGKNAKRVEKRRQDLVKELAEQKSKISKMPGYEGDVEYRDQIVNYLQLKLAVFDEDFGQIVDMEEIAEETYDAMEAYLLAKERASQKLEAMEKVLNESQEAFAVRQNIRLVDGERSKISKKLAQAGKVINYYNPVYLTFFKVFKEEAYFLDALNQENTGALEQHRKSMLSLVKEAKAALDTIPSYNRDGSVKSGCIQMLNFYKLEADAHFPKYIQFYLAKENFERSGKSFNSKKKSQRTKEIIDAYNKSVSDYNNSIKAFNTTNDFLNKTRSQKLDNWNRTVRGFMDRNMP